MIPMCLAFLCSKNLLNIALRQHFFISTHFFFHLSNKLHIKRKTNEYFLLVLYEILIHSLLINKKKWTREADHMNRENKT